MKGMNVYQSTGSGITYYRRYMLSSMLGIISDADTDAKVYTDNPKKTPKKLPNTKPFNKLVKDFDLDVENAVIKDLTPLNKADKNWNKVVKFMNNHPSVKGKSLDKIITELESKYTISKKTKQDLSKSLNQ